MDWPAIVEEQGAALGEAAAVDLGAAVPAAPGWDVAELVRHTGQIFARTSVILQTATMERPSRRNGMLPEPPAGEPLDWYRSTLDRLVVDLRDIGDPQQPVYSFAPGHQRAGFWPRRMAQETVIHRVDAEQAVGREVRPIEPVLAVDGIDEILTIFVPALGADRSPGDGRSVHLHATDIEGEWLIRFDEGRIDVTAGHAKGDAAVRGPAGELLLWLWGRRAIDGLDTFGDPDAIAVLRSITTF
jgi:uncharacterized protein (TIGR03083 family)